LQFSKGSLTILAGPTCPPEPAESDDQLQVDDDSDFLHFRRYWKYPGMGASIGMLCTRKTSGTLGCYIVGDGQLYLLAVKHLVEMSRSYHDNADDKQKVTSPALLDVDQMEIYYKRYLVSVRAEIDSTATAQWGGQEVGSYFPISNEIEVLEKREPQSRGYLSN
jgi:hypothetical protein